MSNGLSGSTDYLKNRADSYLIHPVEEIEEFVEYKIPSTAKTIDQVFGNNQINLPEIQQKKERLGLFKLLKNLLKLGKKTDSFSGIDKNASKTHVVNFAPCLEIPPSLPLNLKNFKLPQLSVSDSPLSNQEIFKELGGLSDKSMYQIMSIVMMIQGELAKEAAIIGLDDFEQFQKMQAYRQKLLKEIKNVLKKDENLQAKFKTVQNLAILAGGVASVAAVFGFTLPLVAVSSAVVSVVATIGKVYYKNSSNKSSAKLTGLDHTMKVSKGFMNDASKRLETIGQDDDSIKVMGKILRDQFRACEKIIKR